MEWCQVYLLYITSTLYRLLPASASPTSSKFFGASLQSINSMLAYHKPLVESTDVALMGRSETAILPDGQACGTSPINSDCNFDVVQDEQIGTVDVTAHPDFDQLYSSTANIVIADDVPALSADASDGVHCGRGQHCKRQTAPMSLYDEILLRFQNVRQISSTTCIDVMRTG